MPKFSEVFFGKKAKTKQLSTVDKNQQELLNLIKEGLTTGEGSLADIFGGFNQEEFEKGVSEPALKNFQEKVLPMLQERFISQNQVGGSGQRNAFKNAGTDLQSKLAELMYGAQQQQKQNKIQGVNQLLGRQTVENIHQPGTEGIAKPLLGAAADIAGNYFTGGAYGAAKQGINAATAATQAGNAAINPGF